MHREYRTSEFLSPSLSPYPLGCERWPAQRCGNVATLGCERNESNNPKGIATSSPRLSSLRGYLGSQFRNGFNRNAVVAFSARRPFNPKRISHPIRSRVCATTRVIHPEIQSCGDAPPARRCIASLDRDSIGSRRNLRSRLPFMNELLTFEHVIQARPKAVFEYFGLPFDPPPAERG